MDDAVSANLPEEELDEFDTDPPGTFAEEEDDDDDEEDEDAVAVVFVVEVGTEV